MLVSLTNEVESKATGGEHEQCGFEYDRSPVNTVVPRSTFLGMPHEIRMLIYDKLVNNLVVSVEFSHDGSVESSVLGSLTILRVSKQIYAEAQRALQVRTLRIHQYDAGNANLFTRIPQAIAKWGPMIEQTLVHYHPVEFDTLLRRIGDISRERMLANLIELAVRLPKLTTLAVTCNGLFGRVHDRDLTDHLSTFSKRLSASLPSLNRVQISVNGEPTQTSYWDVGEQEKLEIKLQLFKEGLTVRRPPPGDTLTKNSTDVQDSTPRKVLLYVKRSPESQTVHWLTIKTSQPVSVREDVGIRRPQPQR